jgi:cellulose synthase/poly-beta-1,6-N-acetylglucosamine synthase-like glycosyltransferase
MTANSKPALAPPTQRLGDILLSQGLITKDELQDALAAQKHTGGRIGQILVSRGSVNRLALSEALARQCGLPHIDLRKQQVDPNTARLVDPDSCRKLGCIPIRQTGSTLEVAIVDPWNINPVHEHMRRVFPGEIKYLVTSEFDIEWTTRAIFHDNYVNESIYGLFYRNPEECAKQTFTAPQLTIVAVLAALFLAGLALAPYPLLLGLNIAAALVYLGISIFRFSIALSGAAHEDLISISPEDLQALDESQLPVYTILIPVFREKEVLPILLQSLSELDYPANKLDIKLLLEEVDEETRQAAIQINPPGNIEFITIPDSQPRTKPKACNYGLISARGKYLVIFDAEDKPEKDQLKKVVCTFNKGAENLICVQAKLNYYNRNQNLLTRWFTCEYSNWFDMILPGLNRAGLPIPLGGTSNHFITEKLRELGGWDPFNVTEDADLGIRMYKHDYQTAIVDSTTFEEANSKLWNWIRQRTRWIKGYLQTWFVNMRHPLRLLKELGLKGTLGFHLTVGGTPFLFIINPIFWVLTTMSFVFDVNLLGELFPPPIFFIAAFNLIIGNFVFVYLNVISTFRRGYYELGKYALLSPIYWVLMSFAAWRALWQLITKPFYWEKTTHGLSGHPDPAEEQAQGESA